ncbi:AAA family ATPase [Geothermobacter hydrogeniphilus]|uniref:AAA family ATPase n=1 Tax=Geothermobacter hydrogeniphilus TaxID=1969733 RepID=A0A2K2H596_9BACT|nr:sigma-54 dependent transcriptional regulator [Geothermobacter hydrogeniphilus]PNU18525.1 AAA family ATPase [Geothermobacter hydrogeniphilus]
MKKILFAWVGMNDIKAAREDKDDNLGPIARVVSEIAYQRLVLLNNYGKEEKVPDYVAWLQKKCSMMIDLVDIDLASPIDFAAIYVAAKKQVERVFKEERGRVVPVFHLSPGTPAMQAVWIMLGKGPFVEAELIQSSREQGVQRVEMPFDIYAEYIPDIQAGADRRLMMLADSDTLYELDLSALIPRHGIIHQCGAMKTLVAQAEQVAGRDVPVLLEGETGTGKELFARHIHAESRRSNRPFLPVNCGAIPKDLFEAEFFGYARGAFSGAVKDHSGYFEQADGGTLFLDELGEMPLDAQVKILRVLTDGVVRRIGDPRERQVDVRIIAATNRDLLAEVAAGRFRADLFYRLAVAMLKLPPLREREGDIHLLLEHILGQVNRELGKEPGYKQKKFSINAKNLMKRHPWPGNAREMHNTILRICVWCQNEVIQEEDVRRALLPGITEDKDDILSRPLGEGFNIQELQAFLSSHYIRRALEESGGNKSRAAALLGLKNYQTLNNWMVKYEVEL